MVFCCGCCIVCSPNAVYAEGVFASRERWTFFVCEACAVTVLLFIYGLAFNHGRLWLHTMIYRYINFFSPLLGNSSGRASRYQPWHIFCSPL